MVTLESVNSNRLPLMFVVRPINIQLARFVEASTSKAERLPPSN